VLFCCFCLWFWYFGVAPFVGFIFVALEVVVGVSLVKGQNVSLSKSDPSLQRVLIGLGWDPRVSDGVEFDLDASVFLLGSSGRVRGSGDFVFYNQLRSACGSVEHTGDNRSGVGDGDDESIRVNLGGVPADVVRIVVTVTIHDADVRRQSFGQVGGAFIRLVNEDSGVELVRFDLSEDHSVETAMVFGEVYRHEGEWKFRAVGQGFAGGLKALASQFGVGV
jgi:tellurium resistance protein TerD